MDTEQLNAYIQKHHLTNSTDNNEPNRILINIDTLRSFNQDLAKTIIEKNLDSLPMVEEELLNNNIKCKEIGFYGELGTNKLNPRSISSRNIGQLISISGIVTKTSCINPKILKSVHRVSNIFNKSVYDPLASTYHRYVSDTERNQYLEKEYRDQLTISKYPPTTTMIPKQSSTNNLLEMEHGLCEYKDQQIVFLQEVPEESPTGVMPVSLEVILSNSLVDTLRCGDRPVIYGTLKALSSNVLSTENSSMNNIRVVLLANHIELNKEQKVDFNYSTIFDKYVNSQFLEDLHLFIAPSIYGNSSIKKSLLFQYLSFYNKIDRDSRRSTINILLVGDPSTAKSQLLRYSIETNKHKSISTTGRGSSGVGLTASIITDTTTHNSILSAGALVKSDGGICCIDEFDKMSYSDRVALHEAMEQGTVSISKAGIHCTLNSRCCVLAASNPVKSSYDLGMSVGDNVGLEMSLISRFDLVWILIDRKEREFDSRVADHVLSLSNLSDYQNNKDTEIGGIRETLTDAQIQEFLKIHLENSRNISPVLSKEAGEVLIRYYAKLRKIETQSYAHSSKRSNKYRKSNNKFRKEENVDLQLPVTPRVLDSLIRLSVSNAKLHQRSLVEVCDVVSVIKLLEEARGISIYDQDIIGEDIDIVEEGEKENVENTIHKISSITNISDSELLSTVKQALLHFKQDGGSVSLEDLFEFINQKDQKISKGELEGVLTYLDNEEGLIMFSSGLVLFLD